MAAGRAGSVTFGSTGQALSVESVSPARGWSYVVTEDSGAEIEVTFRKAGTRVDFHAELEDGDVEIRVRTRTVSGATTTTAPGTDQHHRRERDRHVVRRHRHFVRRHQHSSDVTDVASTSFDDNGGDDNGGDDNGGDDNGGDDNGGDDNGGDDNGGGDDD